MKTILQYVKFELKRFFKNTKLVIIFFISPLVATAVFALFAYQSPKDINIGLVNINSEQISEEIYYKIKENSIFIVHDAKNMEDAKNMLKKGSIKTIIKIDIINKTGQINIVEDPRYPEIQGKVNEEIINSVKDIIRDVVAENAQITAEEKYRKTIDEKFVEFTDEILGQNINTPLSKTISEELEKIKNETILEIESKISTEVSENLEKSKKRLIDTLDSRIADEFSDFSSKIIDILPPGEIANSIAKQFIDYRNELTSEIKLIIESEMSNQMLEFQENIKKELIITVNEKFSVYENRLLPSNPNSPIYLSIKDEIDKFKIDLENEEIDIAINTEPIKLENDEYLSKDINYFDRYASGVIPLVIVLIFLLKAATSFSQDRENGVLERLFSTPASRFKVMLSKIIANVLIGIFALIGIILMLKFAFGAVMGSWYLVFLISFIMAIASVSMGILISVITRDLSSSIQFAFYTFFIIVLSSEFFFASENIHPYFRYASKINPLTYAVSALRKINLFDWGIKDIWVEIIAIFSFALLYSIIAVFLVNRESK